jgi:UDP-glucose 4-epimerase
VKTVVVTGCAGLLGSHFSRHLIACGYRVVGIDDLSGGYAEFLPEASPDVFEFVPIDLSENKFAQKMLEFTFERERPEACFHFAAYAAEGLSPFIRNFNYTNNVLASANVVNACINYDCKLIFTSSMAVYGKQTPPFTEGMEARPIDPYGVAKFAVEMDIKIAGEQHGLRYSIVRPHNVVGIYQNIWDRYRNVAGIFIRRVIAGEPILIYGDGEQTRAFSDIEFYMDPFKRLIEDFDGETFNIGADKEWRICQLADLVCEAGRKHGYKPHALHVTPRHEVKHAHCDHAKAKELLGFKDDTNLEATINQMLNWAMTQPKRPQKKIPYEVTKGIYDYWK